MGNTTSLVKKGMAASLEQMLFSKVTDIDKNKIEDFDTFHIAILQVMSTINSAVAGKRYEVPGKREIEDCYNKWKSLGKESVEKQKEYLGEFLMKNVRSRKGSKSVAVTGLIAPPLAMALRRKGEEKLPPRLKVLKFVPDAVFVPFLTLIALTSVKLGQKIFH